MRVVFGDGYEISLPGNHRFPMRKYPALFETLVRENLVRPADSAAPVEVDWETLALVHDTDYLSDVAHGTLSPDAVRRLGFPWSPALVRRARLAVDGTIRAATMALRDGVAANLAGGTHHGFANRGEGFCVFNDVAVAVRWLQSTGAIRRALIIDLDVHQGNGTADIFAGDERVFTFSIHAALNYPRQKACSDFDVDLPDDAADPAYLGALRNHLPLALAAARADIAFYLAGVDVFEDDRLGRLRVSRAGIHERERYVLQSCRDAGLPLAICLAGGYAATPELTADLHAIVHREAAAL